MAPSANPSWITIPDSSSGAILSPAVPQKGKDGPDSVKHRIFWAAGFMILVIAAFAALAPAQFSALLKGSLFDAPAEEASGSSGPGGAFFSAQGVPENTGSVINPLDLLPKNDQGARASATDKDLSGLSPGQDQASVPPGTGSILSNPVVTPQDQAVDIAVEPLAPAVKECGADSACLASALSDCVPARGEYVTEIAGQTFTVDVEISGVKEGGCAAKMAVTQSPQSSLVGTGADCVFPGQMYTEESLRAAFSGLDQWSKNCSGSAIEGVKTLAEAAKADDAQARLIADLQRQLKEQAARSSAPSAEGLRPAASDIGARAAAAIGQTGLQPGFRANSHRAKISPEETLRRNKAAGVGYAAASQSPASLSSKTDSKTRSLIRAQKTPDSGPAEILMMAFVLAFLGTLGWRLTRQNFQTGNFIN